MLRHGATGRASRQQRHSFNKEQGVRSLELESGVAQGERREREAEREAAAVTTRLRSQRGTPRSITKPQASPPPPGGLAAAAGGARASREPTPTGAGRSDPPLAQGLAGALVDRVIVIGYVCIEYSDDQSV